MSISVSQYFSLSLNVSHFLSVSLNISHCLSVSLNSLSVSQCLSESLNVSQCFSTSLNVYQCVSVSLNVYQCLSMSIRVSQCLSKSLIVSQCQDVCRISCMYKHTDCCHNICLKGMYRYERLCEKLILVKTCTDEVCLLLLTALWFSQRPLIIYRHLQAAVIFARMVKVKQIHIWSPF